jgi:hypothetical protein
VAIRSQACEYLIGRMSQRRVLTLGHVELLGRLDPESYVGSVRWILFADPVLLLAVLLHCLGASVRFSDKACD